MEDSTDSKVDFSISKRIEVIAWFRKGQYEAEWTRFGGSLALKMNEQHLQSLRKRR